jgi:hypothetical protein
VYKSKFKVFELYCRRRGTLARSASPGTVTDFLHYLDVVKKLKPSTIKAYRAAIGHVTRLDTGYDPGEDRVCGLLVKSIERSASPTLARDVEWDVGLVLRTLLEQPEEAMSRHLRTAKTTFLLALATGERRSGLHAISCNTRLEDSTPARLHLQFVEGFVPKAWFLKANRVSLAPIELPCVNEASCETICPVHVTLRYLELVKSNRSREQTSLLVPHTLDKTNNISVHAIPRYVVKLVRWCYETQGEQSVPRIRGHDTRKVAASLAALSGVALDKILVAGNWASASTFLKHYFKTLAPRIVRSLAHVPAVIASTSLITPSLLQK